MGLTQGGVNLRRAGGELNMIWGCSQEGLSQSSLVMILRSVSAQENRMRATRSSLQQSEYLKSGSSALLRKWAVDESAAFSRDWDISDAPMTSGWSPSLASSSFSKEEKEEAGALLQLTNDEMIGTNTL